MKVGLRKLGLKSGVKNCFRLGLSLAKKNCNAMFNGLLVGFEMFTEES